MSSLAVKDGKLTTQLRYPKLAHYLKKKKIVDPISCQVETIFFLSGSPMGHSDTVNAVNEMPDCSCLLNPKFDDIEKLLVEP